MPLIQGIGHIERGFSVYSIATGISGDGHTVIGQSTYAHGIGAFAWRREVGMYNVAPREFSLESTSRGISYDGRWIAGSGIHSQNERQEGFLWDQHKRVARTIPAAGVYGSLAAVSRDGTFALGVTQVSNEAPCGLVVWNLADMSTRSITGARIGFPTSNLYAHTISNDGQRLVGYATNDSGLVQFSFHYDQAKDGEIKRLMSLTDDRPNTRPLAMNAAGTLAVGMGMTADGARACLWHDWSAPPIELPGTPTGSVSSAVAVSADGSVIVGNYNSGPSSGMGVLWLRTSDGQYNLVALDEYLRKLGVVDVEKWSPIAIAGVSDDGRCVCGSALNLSNQRITEPFYAELR